MDWGYVAGFFDGEGSTGLYKRSDNAGCKISFTFTNTNLEALTAIRDFIGCGTIRAKPDQFLTRKVCYNLKLERKADIARVGSSMLPFLIIKRSIVMSVIAEARTARCRPGNRGALDALGAEKIRCLYAAGVSQEKIGRQAGVTPGAVRHFMRKHGIKSRLPKDPIYDRAWTDVARAKLSASRTALWTTDYREKVTVAMRRRSKAA